MYCLLPVVAILLPLIGFSSRLNVDAFHHPSTVNYRSLLLWGRPIQQQQPQPLPKVVIQTAPIIIPRRQSGSITSSIIELRAVTSGRPDVTRSTTNILVIGGTSGIGQLVTQKLASNYNDKYTVRATSRSKVRGEELFNDSSKNIDVVEIDLLQDDTTQLQETMQDVSVVVISVGTTAFPTAKWKGGNTPLAIDNIAVTRIANIASQVASVAKVILVTSVGVDRIKEMPFLILNLFGVLDAKKAGEDAIQLYSIMNTGYQYAIIRPGRLVGGPFTNLDVAKLLQIQGGTENGVTISRGDTLLGDCKRDACAECIVQCIANPNPVYNNIGFSIISNDQPALNDDEWSVALQSVV